MVSGEDAQLIWICHYSNCYRMIKHYSPACPHCRTAAPIYQTLYEYYYVSIHPYCFNPWK
jgi:hypothetical protein